MSSDANRKAIPASQPKEALPMSTARKWLPRAVPVLVAALALGATSLGVGDASSHREAPLIADDPVADATDTYAFVSPDKPDTVTLVGNWVPLEEPAGGPNFAHFGDDVRYDIDVDNNGDNVPELVYQFTFKTTVGSGDTFLYNTGPIDSIDSDNLNVKQTYTVTLVQDGKSTVVAKDLPVAPANIGPRSTPNYDELAAQAIQPLGDGGQVFAGPRDDPFFVDLGSVFDLLGLRPLNGAHLIPQPVEAGVDDLQGYNVHSIVLQVPTEQLTSADDPVIGVWTETYRRKERVIGANGTITNRGAWVQVSRLGMPLVNEVVIPLGKKDKFNASKPTGDAQFLPFVEDPEPARLIPTLYPGVKVPATPRKDLVSIFVTGIEGVNMPKNVKGGEMIRLNTSIPMTALATQDRLGLLAGQMDGFPNGRRLIDDVTDIELRALAGGTPFTADFNISPNNALTDGVDENDEAFLLAFPYLASPHQGYTTRPHNAVANPS
jgi:hypothetical protein